MKRLFKWLIYGDSHLHTWKVIKEGELTRDNGNSIGFAYVLQCEECGNIKVVKDYI